MKKHRKGLAFKTFIFAFILMALILTATLGAFYLFLPDYYLRHKTETLNREADILQEQLNAHPPYEKFMALIQAFSENNIANVDLSAADPVLFLEFILETTPPENLQPRGISFETFIRLDEFRELFPELFPMERHDLTLHRTLTHPAIDYITINATLQPIDEARQVIISMARYLIILGVFIAIIAALFSARKLTKPIIEISKTAARMRKMEAGAVSAVNSNDELEQLADNLNKLYEDLCANMQGLEAEMERTVQLEQSKADFMRTAGHELKTPITALNGLLEVMIDGVGEYKNREKYLPECKAQTERLAKLVHDILTVSKSEVEETAAIYEDTDMGLLLDKGIENYMVLIEQKELRVEIPKKEDFMYYTDGAVLGVVFSNLLSNAVNYSPQGGAITISLSKKCFYIENQCEPVDRALLSKWFEPFYTPDYSRDKQSSGTGLGLYIVKKNLEALKLPFELTATDKGVRFEIAFPNSREINL